MDKNISWKKLLLATLLSSKLGKEIVKEISSSKAQLEISIP